MKLCPKCQKQFPDDANFCPVDAARLIPLEAQASGQDSLATRFELGAKLGGNRTGAVYRATDKTTGTASVVKLVAPAVVALPGIAQRLERELRALERVPSAGVAKVIASGKTKNDQTWVAMELVEGAHTLAEAITARGPIPPPQAADLVECIGEALIEAAQVGVVHRDLAPKNILFAGGDVKLVNFSLPVPNDKTPGVAEFVAPEQVDGKPVDQRSNLYSLGAIYYYVLTGESPRQAADVAPKPPSQLVSTIASGSPIENVIMRALDRSPTKRFLTVRQFIDEVNRIGRSEVIELDKPIAPAPKRPKAELVSTLMGVAKGGGALDYAIKATATPVPAAPIVAAPAVQAPAAIASAPTVGTGVPSVAPTAQPALAPVQAPIMQTVVGMPAPTHSSAQPDPRSPWASPPTTSASPAAATIIGSSPVAAAPAVVVAPAAPVVAAPVVAAAKKNADPAASKDEKKGKFRETMWFKKGDLDTQAAIAAAEERARTGKDVANDKADSLPIDERYKDDGSITRGDKEKYSLRTGGTQMMQAVRGDIGAAAAKVSEDDLIGEMKSGRRLVMIAIAIGVIAAIAIVIMLAS
jgi:eukaryotic-like serine/threonine-protein kinase